MVYHFFQLLSQEMFGVILFLPFCYNSQSGTSVSSKIYTVYIQNLITSYPITATTTATLVQANLDYCGSLLAGFPVSALEALQSLLNTAVTTILLLFKMLLFLSLKLFTDPNSE